MAENGVEISGRNGLDEEKVAGGENLELKCELGDAVANDSKDSEGDEVFEEAMDVPSEDGHLHILQSVTVNGDKSQGMEESQESFSDHETPRSETPKFAEKLVKDLPDFPNVTVNGDENVDESQGRNENQETFGDDEISKFETLKFAEKAAKDLLDSQNVTVNGDENVDEARENQETYVDRENPDFKTPKSAENVVKDFPDEDWDVEEGTGDKERSGVAQDLASDNVLGEKTGEPRQEAVEVAVPVNEAMVRDGMIDETIAATKSGQQTGKQDLDPEEVTGIQSTGTESNGGLSSQLLDCGRDGERYVNNFSVILGDSEAKTSRDSKEKIDKSPGISQAKAKNWDYDMVYTEEIALSQETEFNKQIPDRNKSQKMQNLLTSMASSEEGEAHRSEEPSPSEDRVVMNQKTEESDLGRLKEINLLDSRVEELLQQGKGDESSSSMTKQLMSSDDKPALSRLLERESASSVELDESGTTDDDEELDTESVVAAMKSVTDSVKSIRKVAKDFTASVGSSSAGNSTDPPPTRPAGLGSSASLLEPAPRAPPQPRVNGAVHRHESQSIEDPVSGETDENSETREKLQMIRVKFLRLAHRLGQTPHNVVVAQVLYRLGLAEQLRGSRNTSRAGAFSFDRASAMAEQLEAAGLEDLDFSCTIMVLGKTGVGKSATINSIFDEVKLSTNAFQIGTKKVQDITGTVQGIKVRVIDTPGLLSSFSDQRRNEKILHSVKRFIKKNPPDIVLYLDRLDMQSRDYGDLPLLRTITDIFGPAVWFNAIVVLTHAASAPPDGPSGTPLSYEMFVTQRSHVVQQAIRQAAGDMRLMNPVSLVENHSACRTNRAGQRVLPNGQVWKPQLLLLSFASKILAEANTLLKLQDSPPGKPFGARSRVPPLPFLLSSLLQSRPQLRLPEEQFGDEDTMDDDLDEASDSDGESDYDELPAFKRLTKAQLAKLSKVQKKAYFDELEYREKLFMKKQLKEEKRRRKLMKKMSETAKDRQNEYSENMEEESGSAASVPVPMPDMALPASFDSDNPTHRYRYLDSSNQWLVRPVLETHGWDHDVGYEGLNVERLFVVKDKIPVSVSGQVTKDKKESNLQMELASSIKHGEGKSTTLGFDMQTVGKDIAYTLRSETRFSNFWHNKTAAGLSFTLLGDALTAGLKVEDRLMIHKRFRLVMTGGAMAGRGDVAYGGSLEATLRDTDYPIGRTLSTLGLSVMDWHGDLAIGCNVQSQFPVGRSTNMIARANLNNRGAGQVSIRLSSSEQLQIALIGLVPVLRNIIRNRLFGSPQTMQ